MWHCVAGYVVLDVLEDHNAVMNVKFMYYLKFLKVATAPQLALHNPVATATLLPQTQHVAKVCST